MKLFLLTACTLAGLVIVAASHDQHNGYNLYVRADSRGEGSPPRPGRSRPSSPPPHRAWGETSDSSDASTGSPAPGDRIGLTRVRTRGQNMITHRRKGVGEERYEVGPENHHRTFHGREKQRTKVKGLDDNSYAKIKMIGGNSKLKVDQRQVEVMTGFIGHHHEGQHWGDEVEPGTKKSVKGSPSNEIFPVGYMSGKGTVRGKINPHDIDPTAPDLARISPSDISEGVVTCPDCQKKAYS